MGYLCIYFSQHSLNFFPLPHGQGSSDFVVLVSPHPHDNTIRLPLRTIEFMNINIFVVYKETSGLSGILIICEARHTRTRLSTFS